MQSADAAQHRAHGARAAEGIPSGVEHACEVLRPRRQLPETLHAVPAAGARGGGPAAGGVLNLFEEHQKGLEVATDNLRRTRLFIYWFFAHQVDLARRARRVFVRYAKSSVPVCA